MIDPDRSLVHVVRTTDGVVGTPLCRDHAARLRPPVGWELRDERSPAASRSHADGGDGDLERLLDARSPLLARAFRGVRAPDAASGSLERTRSDV